MDYRRILQIFLLSVLELPWAVAADSNESLPSQYRPQAGAHRVLVRQLVLRDVERKKDLPLRVSFPETGRNAPVIVWSHGMYGSKENYQPLVQFWVSHGYAVYQPTHSDSISLMTPLERRQLLADFNLNRTEDWPNRPRDIQFVLDSLAEIEKQADGLAGRTDPQRIGMGGHSFGAVTTQLVAGTQPRLSELLQGNFADDRPRAFVAISPNGTGPLFDQEGMQQVQRPLLVVSGDNDRGRLGEEPNWRRAAFDHAPPGDKYLLWVANAHHNFGGMSGAPAMIRRLMREENNPENADQVLLVQTVTLAFWDFYLKGDTSARDFLATGRTLTTQSSQTAQLDIKK